MVIKKLMVVAGLLASLAPVAALAEIVIEDYKPDSKGLLTTYDASGARTGQLPKEALPAPQSPVLGVDSRTRMVQVEGPNGPVWLNPHQVRTSEHASAANACSLVARTLVKNGQTGASKDHGARGLQEACK